MGRKNKRGDRGSTETDRTTSKRLHEERNMATADAADEVEETMGDAEEPSLHEIKSMLVEIQITVSDIQRRNNQFAEEIISLRSSIESQKRELDATKTELKMVKTVNDRLQKELEDVRAKAEEREAEIEELYDLQDKLEQYTRKQSLEIHGIPESVYSSTEEAVIKVAEALDVEIGPEDIDISHKLHSQGEKPIIVKFTSHKAKSRLYKRRTGLKNIKLSDLFPTASSAARVEGKKIFINENLTSYRKGLVKKANEKRRQGMLVSVWTLDGKVFVKTSPGGTPIRIFDHNDLECL